MARGPRKPDPAVHICTIDACGGAFRSPSELEIHVRRHRQDKPFPCEYENCLMTFVCAGDMRDHMRIHTGEKPYSCEYPGCQSAFSKSGNLTIHRRLHSGEKPFACQEEGCNVAFAHPSNLKAHARTHAKDKPYACQVQGCSLAFSHSSNLKRHVSSVHEGERPFQCDQCQLAFSQEFNLARHFLRHTGERPHKCDFPLCTAAFTQSSDLSRHRSVHSGQGKRRHKSREASLQKAFDNEGIAYRREVQVDYSVFTDLGSRRCARIDFVVEKDGGFLFVEMDEFQHSGYAAACETRRMQQVFGVYSAAAHHTDKPAAFIRFNPDTFCINGLPKTMSLEERLARLVDVVTSWTFVDKPPYSVTYMFYDTVGDMPDILNDVSLDSFPESKDFLKNHMSGCIYA